MGTTMDEREMAGRFAEADREKRWPADLFRLMLSLPGDHPALPRNRPGADPRAPLPAGFPRGDDAGGRARVGLVTPVLYPAGAESHTMSLVKAVDPARVSWRGLAVLGGPGAREPGISARFAALLPLADGREAALALARSCDLIIGWDLGDLPAAMKAANPRLKIALVSHATPDSDWGRQAMSRLEGVDRVVAVSELAIGADDPGACVIRNAVDVDRLEVRRPRAEMRRLWGVPEEAPVVGQLQRLSSEKGPRALARAIVHLPKDWHAVVVGEGPLKPAPGPRLHVVGGDPAAGDVLNALDALVVASDFESFGLTIAEGLWMGTPVVSTDVGIARLAPGLTRRIPFDAEGRVIAEAILSAHDPERIARARSFAREHLAPGRFGRAWDGLIASLAPAPAPAPTPARAPTPGVARERRLSVLRNRCPHGSKPPGCGCSGRLACAKAGREVARDECFACLESAAHQTT